MNPQFKKTAIILLAGCAVVFSLILINEKSSDQPKKLSTYLSNTKIVKFLKSSSLSSNQQQTKSTGRSGAANNQMNPNDNPQYKVMLEVQAKKRLEMAEEDIEALNNDSQENFGSFASALMRLSTQRNAIARDKARALLSSKDKRLQMIAFRALGYFDEEQVNKELEKISKSSDKDLRRNAVQSLAWNPQLNSGRKEILEKYLKSSKIEDMDSFVAIGALYRMTSEQEEKSDYFKKVMDIAKKPGSSGDKFMATRTLMQMDSKNLEAQNLMKSLEKEREKKKIVR